MTMSLSFLAAPILFLLCAAGLAGAYLSSRGRRLEMERRLSLAHKTQNKSQPEPNASAWEGAAGELGGHVKSFFTFGAGYSWGMHASPAMLIVAALLSGGAVWLISALGFGLPAWVGVAASAGGAILGPRIVLQRQQERANREFTNLFPEAVDMIARMLRGGMPITYAIQVAGNEAPPPVDKVFAMVSGQLRIGIPVAEALDMASTHVALPDFRFFALAAIMQYSTGGNLITTLEDLSQIIRKRQAMRLKAKAVSAEIRFSAYVLGSLPLLVIAALVLIDPEYVAPLFSDRRGHFILAIAGAGLSLSFLIMRQMIRSVSRE